MSNDFKKLAVEYNIDIVFVQVNDHHIVLPLNIIRVIKQRVILIFLKMVVF